MHVFIDTNILLSFYHFSKDELDALNNVFASHEHGSATVYLTEQVCDEFKRNRESKIKDALKRFTDVKFNAQIPSFMKEYGESAELRRLCSELQSKHKAILKVVNGDIAEKNLMADRLIGDIFAKYETISTTEDIYQKSTIRMAIGNPPGKNDSIGDAINWIQLLESVPNEEDLHVISADGDFYSVLNEHSVHPFLSEEWHDKKSSKLFVYRTLSEFMAEHFDGVAFSFDKNKDALIDDLASSGSFATTHNIIGKLDEYSYFSLKEVERIFSAGSENSQVRQIWLDDDISDFLNRVAVPHLPNITEAAYRKILESVIEDQEERAKDA